MKSNMNEEKEKKNPPKKPQKPPVQVSIDDSPRDGKWEQFMPIILSVVALLFIVSFVFTGVNESGIFGKIFGSLLYGLFSLPAWLIPALLLYFAFVYRKERQNGTLGVRVGMTLGAYVTFLCIYYYFSVCIPDRSFSMSAVEIWRKGQDFVGSGLAGSYLGYFICRVFGMVGTPIVLFPLFAILMVFLFGLTPRQSFVYIKAKLREWRQAAKDKKANAPIEGTARPAVMVKKSGQTRSTPRNRSDNDILEKPKTKQSDIDFS